MSIQLKSRSEGLRRFVFFATAIPLIAFVLIIGLIRLAHNNTTDFQCLQFASQSGERPYWLMEIGNDNPINLKPSGWPIYPSSHEESSTSVDGRHVAYLTHEEIQHPSYRFSLFLQDKVTGRVIFLKSSFSLVFGWSPDGTRLVFAWSEFEPNVGFRFRLAISDATGNIQHSTKISFPEQTFPAPARFLGWSADGQYVAIDAGELWTVVIDTRSLKPFFYPYSWLWLWSPRGHSFAYYRVPTYDAIVIDSPDAIPVTIRLGGIARADNDALRWSPDGKHIVLSYIIPNLAQRTSSQEYYKAFTTTGVETIALLGSTPELSGSMRFNSVWTRDGRFWIYVRSDNTGSHLMAWDAIHRSTQTLVPHVIRANYTSAGGKERIAVVQAHGSQNRLLLFDLASSQSAPLASNIASNVDMWWSEDGTYFVAVTRVSEANTPAARLLWSRADGTNVQMLGYEKARLAGKWSQDNHSVLYMAGEGDNYKLFRLDLKSGGSVPLITGLSDHQFEQISQHGHWELYPAPDNQRVAISFNVDYGGNLDGVSLGELSAAVYLWNGTNTELIRDSLLGSGSIVWRPDGLAFAMMSYIFSPKDPGQLADQIDVVGSDNTPIWHSDLKVWGNSHSMIWTQCH